MSINSPEAQALLQAWRTETDFGKRDELLEQMSDVGLFPQIDQDAWEHDAGLFPDIEDPNFLPKMMQKREFLESKQPSVKESLADGVDRCRTTEDFELSSVQRFLARLFNPRTPYQSALVFHGVGVGKTCTAVTICEAFLERFPGRKAYVVAPPNIQAGFRRTLFDPEGLTMGPQNNHRGCTGNTYLQLTAGFTEKNKDLIQDRITREINTRYEFFGYSSLYNFIRGKIAKEAQQSGITDPEQLEAIKQNVLRREFSNRVLIIDEAHNLRDITISSDDDDVDDASIQDTKDSEAGKKLTPFLRDVLSVSEDLTLILMTATPMFNSYLEIIFLLNLLLLNDKRPELRIDQVFDTKTQKFVPGGEKLLGRIANTYISYMRGENPLTFPLRLSPESSKRITEWPIQTPKGDVIEDDMVRENILNLPCVGASFTEDIELEYYEFSNDIVQSKEGLGITNMDTLVQAGNWIFPGEPGDSVINRIGQRGFDAVFEEERSGDLIQFKDVEPTRRAKWLLRKPLPNSMEMSLQDVSGKAAVLLDRLNLCRGVAFVYSRFVKAGALTIALALEANGYLPYGRDVGFLAEGSLHPEGRQCALCPRHERNHGLVPEEKGTPAHKFKQARYVLLTGSPDLSPSNAASVTAARAKGNVDGGEIKVVIGSQIAGEGLDLRFIREVFVYDSWYHLNKLEQIIGRGIRNCSHSLLDPKKRNCTITLLVNQFAQDPEMETADMYSYRVAFQKAVVTGRVTRVLKEYALDCSLNRDAIVVSGLSNIPLLLDSQGESRTNVNRNDVPFSTMCDWISTCEYSCRKGDGAIFEAKLSEEQQDISTYDLYTARYQMNTIRNYLVDLIANKGQSFISFEQIAQHFSLLPQGLLSSLLNEMVFERNAVLDVTGRGRGRLLYRNGYYIFQPLAIRDVDIPSAIRFARVPVPRDRYPPRPVLVSQAVKESAEVVDDKEDSEELWNQALLWSQAIREGRSIRWTGKVKDSYRYVPAEFFNEVRKLKQSASGITSQGERLEMITWIYTAIENDKPMRELFSIVMLQYIWDEFVTIGTKRELLQQVNKNPILKTIASDSFWELKGSTYIRLFNDLKNTIEYYCFSSASGTYEKCSDAMVERLEQQGAANDPILSKPLDVKTTGKVYGFISYNPKKLHSVFKKGEPPSQGKIPGRGKECSISSGTSYERAILDELGSILRANHVNDLGMNDATKGSRRVENSIRVCTLSDLVLRMMDIQSIQGKRWFYRGLASKLYNHPLK